MVADYYPYLLEACRENVLPLTSRCNLGCVFCSNKQNPAQILPTNCLLYRKPQFVS